jgi:capsule polysaccharide export protein KpsC/LpsZ
VALLATNVIGDSLTLGRQVFSDSMTKWLARTVLYFAGKPAVQLVVRIHPGELITKGPSVAEVVQNALPGGLPDHIHLVAADAAVNTYDIVEIADLGLVYTTTVGLEMAMSGVPVIAIGQTHYRGRGFTLDPDSWQAYFDLLECVLENPQEHRLNREQVELAWEYAYRFFFEYPHPFPWHLVHLWEDLGEWPMERVLSEEGQDRFGNTFRCLAGEPVDWARKGALVELGEQA